MPNEVINTINQLAATRKKYKGITFTEKEGNIINDENEDNIEITGVNKETCSPDKETYSAEITYSPDEEIYSPNKDTYIPPKNTQQDSFTTDWDKKTFNRETTRVLKL